MPKELTEAVAEIMLVPNMEKQQFIATINPVI